MIIILVEGEGDQRSIPYLLKRTIGHGVNIRCIEMGGKSNIVRYNDGFERTISRWKGQGYKKFYVLLDKDVTFPPYSSLAQEVRDMPLRAERLSSKEDIVVEIFWAIRSFESWLIGGLKKGDNYCGLRKVRKPVSGDTEASPSNPKQWIKGQLENNRYNVETQECLTRHIYWSLAKTNNKSLRDFLSRF